jgi:threonylcarbamoyladenosine tRNA methylthiotransferase MtaB
VTFSIVTFGCRVNQADSLALEVALGERGAHAVSADRADVVVVNTCSVTASADQGARQTIRRLARTNPAGRIVVTGCYASRCADEVRDLPGVIDVIPNSAKDATTFVARLVDRHAIELEDGPCGRALSPGLMGRTAWTLRVQTGCSETCSYCIIPTTRGPGRSLAIDDVRAEVERAMAAGYREIVVTGVHLGSYGRDLALTTSLTDLLRMFATATESLDVLFRVSSLEPMDCTSAVLDALAAPPFAPHLHLPLQHAANRVLGRMRRPYTIEQYDALVTDVRRRLPDAALGSDVIVGFPGETDDDFAALASYLESSPLTHLHVFPYSDRPGTAASALPDTVHGSVVKARAQAIRDVSRRLQQAFRDRQRGRVRRALTIEDGTAAITDNYIRVPAPSGHARNEWVDVVV